MYHVSRIAIITTLLAALSVCAVECRGIEKNNGHSEFARTGASLCGDVNVEHFKAEAEELISGKDVEAVVARLKSAASRKGPKAPEARSLAAAVDSARNALKDTIRGNAKSRPGLAFLQIEMLVKTWPSEKAHCSKALKKLSASEDVQAAVNLRRALEAEDAPQDASQRKKRKPSKKAAISAAMPFVKSEFPGVAREIGEMILAADGIDCENANVDNNTPITIIGDDEFIEKTKTALFLVEKDATRFYTVITNYVSIIRRGDRSGMRAYDPLPTFKVGKRTAQSKLTWYASTIVHDAHHSKLYNDYLKTSGSPVPSNIWAGREAENYCLSAQEEFLEAIHAPKHLVEHVRKMRNVDYFSSGVNRNW